jgi:hypothetical protein
MTQMSVPELAREKVTHIVSLGHRCATAYNLRRHFDFSSAFPFDWWITPGTSIADFLRNPDVNYLYEPSELQLTEQRGSVRHRTLGILLHHEFPRDWKSKPPPVVENFRDFVAEPKRRSAYLIAKLLRLNTLQNRVLFIRDAPIGQETLDALSDTFPLAVWATTSVSRIPEDEKYGWKCDPTAWDSELSKTGVLLDRTNHRPFFETKAEHSESDL